MSTHTTAWPQDDERRVERHLVKTCQRGGMLQYKFTSPGRRGVPDRLVLHPRWPGQVLFVEVKRPTTELRPQQVAEHQRMIRHGAVVVTVHTREEVEQVLASFARHGTQPPAPDL